LPGEQQTICLSMIVKNEASVIERCLRSVRPIITYWIIVDTGSTDGTQDVIRAYFSDVPGSLYERPWESFSANRSEALRLARLRGDYTFVIDADDELVSGDFRLPRLTCDSYSLDIDLDGISYRRPQLINNALPWRYEGVLHEYLECEGARTSGHLPMAIKVNSDGARRKDPETYRHDAALLEKALSRETDPFRTARYTFYLAQSYRDCGEMEKAAATYLKRTRLGFWDQEIFVSFYFAAQMREQLGDSEEVILALYEKAMQACPSRAEAAYRASRFCRLHSKFQRGYEIAKAALDLPPPGDGLFVERWVYDYGLLDEFAVNAYWSGHYRECLDGVLRALASRKVPDHEQQRFVANAQFALQKLN
jgi:glycosyltransferase involved in cell wall biosynthesis